MNFSQRDFNETSMRALIRKNSIFKNPQLAANQTATDLKKLLVNSNKGPVQRQQALAKMISHSPDSS